MKYAAAIVVLIIMFASAALLYLNRPLTLVVRNLDSEALHAVVVHVTGNAISMGDIPAGQSREIQVTTTGESHVELELPTGRLIVNCYFEQGYGGRISAEITRNTVVSAKCDVHV
jgi:2-methylaconitate cis-trans-isomerase PrpF